MLYWAAFLGVVGFLTYGLFSVFGVDRINNLMPCLVVMSSLVVNSLRTRQTVFFLPTCTVLLSAYGFGAFSSLTLSPGY